MRRRLVAALVATALAAAAGGCGGDDGSADASDASGAADGSGAGGGEGFEPATITDCNGVEATFEAPPERTVTLTFPVLELLFWLGVEDTVVGTGSPPEPGDLPEEFEAEALEVPKLAGEYEAGAFQPVPREILIGNDPDFVIGGFSSNFETEGAASQDDLAERDIPSYLALSMSCAAAQDGPVEDLDLTYRDLENLGAAFGVPDRATELVDDMEATVADVEQRLGDVAEEDRPSVFAFEFDEGTETPYATGNRQTVNAVIHLAGGRNVFDDLDTDYEQVNWEEIIRRDPEVILVINYAEGDEAADEAGRQEAEDFLTGFEPIQSVEAVQERRFVHLLYEEGSAGGYRNAEAVQKLADQLHPDTAG